METLAVDATDAPRKVFHAKLTIPATPGDFVLLYPQVDSRRTWSHRPSGGHCRNLFPCQWPRALPGIAIRWICMPTTSRCRQGVTSIDATIDYLSPVEMPGGFSAGSSATDKLAVLSWNWLVLYPKGRGSDDIGVKASLKLPAGWQWASALPHSSSAAGNG